MERRRWCFGRRAIFGCLFSDRHGEGGWAAWAESLRIFHYANLGVPVSKPKSRHGVLNAARSIAFLQFLAERTSMDARRSLTVTVGLMGLFLHGICSHTQGLCYPLLAAPGAKNGLIILRLNPPAIANMQVSASLFSPTINIRNTSK